MAELLTAATPISYYLVAVNIIAFILYGTDKAKAMHHQWRIKEAVLIGIAFVGDHQSNQYKADSCTK